jgi:hypothetical protein
VFRTLIDRRNASPKSISLKGKNSSIFFAAEKLNDLFSGGHEANHPILTPLSLRREMRCFLWASCFGRGHAVRHHFGILDFEEIETPKQSLTVF